MLAAAAPKLNAAGGLLDAAGLLLAAPKAKVPPGLLAAPAPVLVPKDEGALLPPPVSKGRNQIPVRGRADRTCLVNPILHAACKLVSVLPLNTCTLRINHVLEVLQQLLRVLQVVLHARSPQFRWVAGFLFLNPAAAAHIMRCHHQTGKGVRSSRQINSLDHGGSVTGIQQITIYLANCELRAVKKAVKVAFRVAGGAPSSSPTSSCLLLGDIFVNP